MVRMAAHMMTGPTGVDGKDEKTQAGKKIDGGHEEGIEGMENEIMDIQTVGAVTTNAIESVNGHETASGMMEGETTIETETGIEIETDGEMGVMVVGKGKGMVTRSMLDVLLEARVVLHPHRPPGRVMHAQPRGHNRPRKLNPIMHRLACWRRKLIR